MRLCIRADANSAIGTGHIMRCIALAQAWQDQGGHVTFVSHCESTALAQRIIREGFGFIPIEYPHPHPSDIRHTLDALSAISYQLSANCWFVLDGYHFTPEYHKAIRDTGICLLVIDDMNHLPYYRADILLNQNIHATDLEYCCNGDAILLLGSRYVLLRREFLKYRHFKRQTPNKAKKILVTLGGADPDNVTLKIIKALNLLKNSDIEVRVVVGPANPHVASLKHELDSSPFAFHLLQSVNNMPELMAWADLAISAAGSTCWELIFLSLPTIVLVLTENQLPVAEYLMNNEAVVNLGWSNQCSCDSISLFLESFLQDKDLRDRLSTNGSTLVNGQGASLTTDCMIWRDIELREVTNDDRELIWLWANDEEARKASYSQHHISWDEHVCWFSYTILRKDIRFYVAENRNKEPFGQIRFVLNNDEAIISLSIARESRFHGYGNVVLTKAIRKVFNESKIRRLVAYVKAENKASAKLFQRAGFCLVEEIFISRARSYKMIMEREALK